MIQRACMRTTNGDNRGIKPANYYVLRKNKLPAVLVECGFLTNRQDLRWLLARSIGKAWRPRLQMRFWRFGETIRKPFQCDIY